METFCVGEVCSMETFCVGEVCSMETFCHCGKCVAWRHSV